MNAAREAQELVIGAVGRGDVAAAREAQELVIGARGRRRRSARREAAVRRRRFVALVVIVVVVAIVALLIVDVVRAGAATSPGAGAALASIGAASVGSIQIDPSVANDEATVSDSYRSHDLRFVNGVATASSYLVGTALVSETDVSLSDVSLLGGVVKADAVELVATADAGRASADADSSHSYVSGLEVDGKPVAADAGPFSLPGVGTLTILDATVAQSGPSPSAVVTGLTITLDQQLGDLAAGSVIVVGRAAASSDATTAAQLPDWPPHRRDPPPCRRRCPRLRRHRGPPKRRAEAASQGRAEAASPHRAAASLRRVAAVRVRRRLRAAASPTVRCRRRPSRPRPSWTGFPAPCSLCVDR